MVGGGGGFDTTGTTAGAADDDDEDEEVEVAIAADSKDAGCCCPFLANTRCRADGMFGPELDPLLVASARGISVLLALGVSNVLATLLVMTAAGVTAGTAA